jgi:hypothetical protein
MNPTATSLLYIASTCNLHLDESEILRQAARLIEETPDLHAELKALKAEKAALLKKLRSIHSLCISPDWSAKRRWRIAELSSP